MLLAADFASIEARVLSWYPDQPRSKPMFTKQHYVAVAHLLSARRERIRSDSMLDRTAGHDASQQMNAVNEVVVDFVRLFKQDNPKFKDLLFIGACDALGTQPDAGQK